MEPASQAEPAQLPTLFSLFYFVSLFTSKIDILLHLTSSQLAKVYINCTVHPTLGATSSAVYLFEYIMSRAASDIGDVNGALGGRPQPPSPPTSVYPSPSPASPPSPLGPLDLIKRYDVIRTISELHIKKDATYIAPASMDIKDIYNKSEEPTFDTTDLSLEDIILRYFRACPLHRNDTKIGYIVVNEKDYQHLWDNDKIKLTNVDIAMTWLRLPEPLPAHPHPSTGYRCHQLQDCLMHLVGIKRQV